MTPLGRLVRCSGSPTLNQTLRHFTAVLLLPKTLSAMRTFRITRRIALGLASVFAIVAFHGRSFAAPPGLREALAEFETGTTQPTHCEGDDLVGGRKEISRFQILPVVWQQYSSSDNHRDPDTAWSVAEQILNEREQTFRRATGREWDAVDIYLMWNAPGAYRRAEWDRTKLSRVLLERAQRFANLMEARARSFVAGN